MDQFFTLREFLLLKDKTGCWSLFKPTNPIRHNDSPAEDLIHRYDIAKASWEKYGDAGPPVGCKIEVLEAGHGNSRPGVHRHFLGDFNRDPNDWFALTSRPDNVEWESHSSIVHKKTWWAHIQVVEE